MLEFVKENKKFIYITIIILGLFVAISSLINSCSHSVIDNLMSETKAKERIKILSMHNEKEAVQVLVGIAKKNSDWSTYPLSKEFLEKYNSKDGIFPQHNFNSVDWGKMPLEQYDGSSEEGFFYYTVGDNLTLLTEGPAWNIAINYTLNNMSEISTIEIIYDKQTVDEQGNSIIEYDKELNVNNFKNIIWDILFYDGNLKYPYGEDLLDDRAPIEITKQPCSKKFCDKVLNKDKNIDRVYIDFFPQYNCGGGAIYFLNGVSRDEAFNNREFYVTCRTYFEGARPYDGDKPEHNYLYKLNFEIDENNKLDDISLEYLYEISNEELLDKFHF